MCEMHVQEHIWLKMLSGKETHAAAEERVALRLALAESPFEL